MTKVEIAALSKGDKVTLWDEDRTHRPRVRTGEIIKITDRRPVYGYIGTDKNDWVIAKVKTSAGFDTFVIESDNYIIGTGHDTHVDDTARRSGRRRIRGVKLALGSAWLQLRLDLREPQACWTVTDFREDTLTLDRRYAAGRAPGGTTAMETAIRLAVDEAVEEAARSVMQRCFDNIFRRSIWSSSGFMNDIIISNVS